MNEQVASIHMGKGHGWPRITYSTKLTQWGLYTDTSSEKIVYFCRLVVLIYKINQLFKQNACVKCINKIVGDHVTEGSLTDDIINTDTYYISNYKTKVLKIHNFLKLWIWKYF